MSKPTTSPAGSAEVMGKRIAHEMHAAPLPGGAQNLGRRRLQAFVSIGDHQLDAGQATAVQGTEKVRPEGFGLGRADRKGQDLTARQRAH